MWIGVLKQNNKETLIFSETRPFFKLSLARSMHICRLLILIHGKRKLETQNYVIIVTMALQAILKKPIFFSTSKLASKQPRHAFIYIMDQVSGLKHNNVR